MLPVVAPREIENSLFLGVAQRLGEASQKPFMLALQAADGVAAAALRTPPYRLQVWVRHEAAIAPLSNAVLATGEPMPAVMGLDRIAAPFAVCWAQRTGCAVQPSTELTLYCLTEVVPPGRPAAGALRLATADDEPWLTDWYVAFGEEAGLPEWERTPEQVRRALGHKLARGHQFVWEDGGRTVAIVGYTPAGLTGARVAPVRTVPGERGKGYASTAVAHLTQHLLENGHGWCSLFADVANPQANRIYQRLGYREACRFRAFEFG